MLVGARGLAEIIANRQTQIVQGAGASSDFFTADVARHPGARLDLRAGRGRRLGPAQPHDLRPSHRRASAATPRRPGSPASTSSATPCYLYVLSASRCGIAAVMMIARTTTGTSTHGSLYELDAIAAVVIGGTLLSGGRGTIVGTVLGVLIFTTLTNIFTLNNLLHLGPADRQGSDHRRRRAAPAAASRANARQPSRTRPVRTSSAPAPSQPRSTACPCGPRIQQAASDRAGLVAGPRPRSPRRLHQQRPDRRHRRRSRRPRRPAAAGANDEPGDNGRHRLLRPRRRPRLDGRDHQVGAIAEADEVRRRRAAGRRGHQRRQPADQPGRDLHQRRVDAIVLLPFDGAALTAGRASRRWRPASRSSTSTASSTTPFAARTTVLGDNYGMGVSAGTYICEQLGEQDGRRRRRDRRHRLAAADPGPQPRASPTRSPTAA